MVQARRAWAWLGTAGSVRAITAGMLVYALVIGLLVYGYAQVSNCLAEYADKSAKSTAARAALAAEDRLLDLSERALDDSDRAVERRADDALDLMLDAMAAQDQQRVAAAFAMLRKARADAAATHALNDTTREENRKTRAANEEERKRNPPPPPPSQSC